MTARCPAEAGVEVEHRHPITRELVDRAVFLEPPA